LRVRRSGKEIKNRKLLVGSNDVYNGRKLGRGRLLSSRKRPSRL